MNTKCIFKHIKVKGGGGRKSCNHAEGGGAEK